VAIVQFTAAPPGAEPAAPPPAQGLDQWLQSLQSENRLLASTVVSLSTLDGQMTTAQFGAREPLAMSQTRIGQGGRDAAVTYEFVELGTIVTATPRITANGAILLNLRIEGSSVASEDQRGGAAAQAEGAGEIIPPSVTRLSTQSALRLQDGQTAVAYRQDSSFPPNSAQTQILVTAQAGEAPQAALGGGQVLLPQLPPENDIRVFRLQNAQAPQAAAVLTRLMNQRLASIGIDEEANSIIVRGPPAELDRVETILERLDGAPLEPRGRDEPAR
jgi:type II secretory pathway component GspD/PulD (secretin)